MRSRRMLIDPYEHAKKLPEGSACSECGVVYHKGRWQWSAKPEPSHEGRCPACHRIHDEFPAGVVKLTGSFAVAHKEEIIGLVRHQEEAEKKEHPLSRIMKIEGIPDEIVIDTTDIHLSRWIGNAVEQLAPKLYKYMATGAVTIASYDLAQVIDACRACRDIERCK